MSLNLKETETLTRLLETGTVRSADLLGKMSRTEWGVMSSSIKEMSVVRVLAWFQRTEGKHVGARFRSGSSLPLDVLVLFSEPSARAVTDAVTKPFGAMRELKNLVALTIGEVSNVMAQSVLGTLADAYGASIILSAPEVQEGTKVDLLAKALDAYDGREDLFLMSHVDMFSENLSAECSMIVTVNAAALRRLLAKSAA